jgi:hypothetical protein
LAVKELLKRSDSRDSFISLNHDYATAIVEWTVELVGLAREQERKGIDWLLLLNA